MLLATDEVRPAAVTVKDEVRHGLYFVATSIWDVVPRLHADLDRAFRQSYGEPAGDLGPILRYRSWIGGDRDGNPNVTPQVTAWTLRAHREDALRLHRRALDRLRLDLSVSDQQVDLGDALRQSVEGGRATADLPERRWRQNAHEPIRLKLMQMGATLDRLIETLPAGDSGQARQPGDAAGLRRRRLPRRPRPDRRQPQATPGWRRWPTPASAPRRSGSTWPRSTSASTAGCTSKPSRTCSSAPASIPTTPAWTRPTASPS